MRSIGKRWLDGWIETDYVGILTKLLLKVKAA